ncbi:ribose-5-phosphate isomerase [Candidatus Poribacteria bacterium]
MKIAIGADHAGFDLKDNLKRLLKEKGYECDDLGAETFDPQDDYPEFGQRVAKAVASGEYDRGIVMCGTGMGISISANKVPGVRAAVCYSTDMARISRAHNDANVLALGGRIVAKELALDIATTWLETGFEGEERHARRIRQLEEI